MGDTIFYDVDLAADVKTFIIINHPNIKFIGNTEKIILNANDDDLLLVGTSDGSTIKILSVDKVTPEFIKSYKKK